MNENVINENFKKWDSNKDFICPDCGRKSPEVRDAGNGFCDECAPNH